MKPADVAIESDHGLYLFRPETARGREWLKANVPTDAGHWQPGGLLVESAERAQPIIVAMGEAGLEVAEAPRYYLQRRQQTDDGEWLH